MITPPLTWTIDLASQIDRQPIRFSATTPELEALKAYAEIQDLISFEAQVHFSSLPQGKVRVQGRFEAGLLQVSVVTLDDVKSALAEDFAVEYWPQELIAALSVEDMSPDEDAPEALSGNTIPIGAYLSELFALSIDPYPRNEGETLDWRDPQEDTSNPFAALLRLEHPGKTDTHS